jgi:hypothetical protein
MYVEQIKKFTQAGNVEFKVIETQQPSGNNVFVSEKLFATSKTQKNCFLLKQVLVISGFYK